jgi:hypothetical protein
MELSPEAQARVVDVANKLAEYIANRKIGKYTEGTVQQFIDRYATNFGYAYQAIIKAMGYKQVS